jgi:RNA-directed DNA polymerase
VAHFLKERGLELSHEKTQITHVEQGFDFLGQNVRRYRCGKVLTKPSARNVKTFLTKIRETIKNSGSQTVGEMIRRLNQQIKGWTMYHRYAASKRTFSHVDDQIFQMVWRWCRRRHPNKNQKWIKKKYFWRDGHRHWVFTGLLRDQKGQGWPIQLMTAASVKIIRYVKIRSAVNPYDPEWELYLEARWCWQLAQTRTGRSRIEYVWTVQEGRCVVCGQPLRIAEEDCQIHHRIWRSEGGPDTADNLELLHANCHRQIHVQEGRTKAAASRKGRL